MSILTRELGAQELTAAFAYLDSTEIVNDYDNKYPWNSMKIIYDEKGNKFLQIPKFYTHYEIDDSGYISARYISQYCIDKDTWHLNPAFLRADGEELPYIEIGCYQASLDSSGSYPMSVSGATISQGKQLSVMKTLVENYNSEESVYNYGLYDIWCHILIQDLLLIEFANTNTAEFLPGYTYSLYQSGLLQTGVTDDLPYVTGIASLALYSDQPEKYGMKYRELENIVGNGHTILDNIRFNGTKIIVNINGVETISSIERSSSSGLLKKLAFDNTTKLVYTALTGIDGKYGDYSRGNSDTNHILIIGRNSDEGYGIFSYGNISATSSDVYGTYRLIRKIK